MFDDDSEALRADMEAVLQQEARAAIGAVLDRLPGSLARALPGLAECALEFHRENVPMPAHAHALEALCRERALPGLDARETWCALADWLLTNAGTCLRAPRRNHGFPAKGRGEGAQERIRRKAAFVEWLVEAAGIPGLAEALQRVRELPPARFSDSAWTFVVAVMKILPHAARALEDVFRMRAQADCAEATLRALTALGHAAIGLDGAASFVAMAREYSGCEVLQQDFLALDLPSGRFDGIFANATLQHVPTAVLPRVLRQLRDSLKPRGVLFASNPRGRGEEGWHRGRYGAYHDEASWSRYVGDAGFLLLDQYYRPAGRPREQQPWLATVWRKA